MICPSSMRAHADQVLKGEYALPEGFELEGVKSVLDIGANVGAFALWARRQWHTAIIHCYEPSLANFRILRQNLDDDPKVTTTQVGVASQDGVVTFYAGRNNCGETSRHDLGEQDTTKSFEVGVVDAASLPNCDVLKVDTEGCELEIIGRYLVGHGTAHRPAVILLEWHRATDRWLIGALLVTAGYECVRDEVRRHDRGVMAWVQA